MEFFSYFTWHKAYREWLAHFEMTPRVESLVYNISIIVLTIIASLVLYKLVKKLFYKISNKFSKNIKSNRLISSLNKNNFFSILGYYAPLIVIRYCLGIMLPRDVELTSILNKGYHIFHVVLFAMLVYSILSTIIEVNQYKTQNHSKPIKGLIQFIQFLLWFFAAIIVVSILISEKPLTLIGGLGAASAILMLIFKDSITGLVAGVQLSFNGMVKIGDWITLDKYGVDGVVIDITLTSVKVKNWDNSISSIPSYNLMTVDSVKNWKNMQKLNSRQISRSVLIDMHSVRFCSSEMLERFKNIQLLSTYISEIEIEVNKYNEENKVDTSHWANGKRITNLGVFRTYLVKYLKNRSDLNQNADLYVRLLQSTNFGIPLHIYCFSNVANIVSFEKTQSDILDHIISIVPFFDLNLFQSPSDMDFAELKATKLHLMQEEIMRDINNSSSEVR